MADFGSLLNVHPPQYAIKRGNSFHDVDLQCRFQGRLFV
jgi:hypothetical protein